MAHKLISVALALFCVLGLPGPSQAIARASPSPDNAYVNVIPAAQTTVSISVSALSSPQSTIGGKLVEDNFGRPLGHVRSVIVGPHGKAEVVNVEVPGLLNLGTRIMAINADRIVYYPADAKLVASLSTGSI